MEKFAGRETPCRDDLSQGQGEGKVCRDEGIFLSLSDTRRGKGGFPGALETCRVTCWAPVCELISICDCSQLQGEGTPAFESLQLGAVLSAGRLP